MLVTALIALRDILIVAALSWIGVSLEARTAEEPPCRGQNCEQQQHQR